MPELPWYAKLREQWRPQTVRILLVGESAPDPADTERRFFYAPTLTRHDNLFRGVVQAFYEAIPAGMTGAAKRPWLERLQADGVFLIDLVPYPVNHLSEPQKRRERRKHVPALVEQAKAMDPAGVIVCHGGVYTEAAEPLRTAGLPLLHDDLIPFPLYAGLKRFPVAVRAAAAKLD